MGITKKHIHTERQIALAELFKALGHPARIAIIDNLLIHQDLNCNDLRKYIQLAQSTISAHIKQLREVGILCVKVVANNAFYLPYKDALEEIKYCLDLIVKKIETLNLDRQFVYCKPVPTIFTKKFVDNS